MDGTRVESRFGVGEGVRAAGGRPHPDWVEQSACPLGPLPRGEGMELNSFLPDGEFGFQSG